MNQNTAHTALGIFDSGMGGLSVLRAIHKHLPNENLIYLADQAHVPYGPRPLAQVQDFSEAIVEFFLQQSVKLIVVACNTASAAALHHLRKQFPLLPFVGMEPAVKPAAEQTHTRVVGVMATPATFQSALYASVLERFANSVEVLQHTCPGLVQQIELGDLDSPATREILESALQPMLRRGIDTIVLGCTHYPFVIPLIQEIVGDDVRVIDPAPAIARQTERILETNGLKNGNSAPGKVHYFTTGKSEAFFNLLKHFNTPRAPVDELSWQEGKLIAS